MASAGGKDRGVVSTKPILSLTGIQSRASTPGGRSRGAAPLARWMARTEARTRREAAMAFMNFVLRWRSLRFGTYTEILKIRNETGLRLGRPLTLKRYAHGEPPNHRKKTGQGCRQ